MSYNRPLHKFIGDPVCMLAPSTQSSDGVVASDAAGGVPIEGAAGVMIMQILGTWDTNAVQTVGLYYSSTGNASDAASSATAWTFSDAAFTALTTNATGYDSDTPPSNSVTIMDIDLSAKGLSDAAGKIFVTIAAAETGASTMAIVGIPYFGNKILPATNAQTVIEANAAV